MEIPICERFLSFQGEGRSVGRLAYFVRVQGCNLSCKFCDSKYALKPGKGKKEDTNDIYHDFQALPGDPLMVVTGGEPLLYQDAVVSLVERVPFASEIETNGTIMPIPELVSAARRFNVSPKLPSSGEVWRKAIKLKVLTFYSEWPEAIFKFVIKTQKDWDLMEELIQSVGIFSGDVWIMPEGTSAEKIRMGSLKWAEKIKEKGYNLSPRYHVTLYGNRKGV